MDEEIIAWATDAVKVLFRRDDLTFIQHLRTGRCQISIKGADGEFHTADLSQQEVATIYKHLYERPW